MRVPSYLKGSTSLGLLMLAFGGTGCLFGQGVTLQANPNPIISSDGSGYGTTTLTYSAPNVQLTSIYVEGTLFCSGGSSGSCVTGNWVSNGLTFELRDQSNGAVLASLVVQVNSTDLACASVTPTVATPITSTGLVSFTVSGVSNATSVDFLIQPANTPLGSATVQPGTLIAQGSWRAVISASGFSLGGYKVTPRLRGGGGSELLCNRAGFFSIVAAQPNATQLTRCSNIGGVWTDNIAPRTGTLTLTQNSTGGLSGNLRQVAGAGCPVVTWSVQGQMTLLTGQFSLDATNPNPASNLDCFKTSRLRESGSVGSFSCTAASGTYTILNQSNIETLSRPFSMTKAQADLPSGETSTFSGWSDAYGYPTQGMFRGQLSSSQGVTFGGRAVAETEASGGTDGCYFPGSEVQQLVAVTGGVWPVSSSNVYGEDYVGMAPAVVGYYQTYRPLNNLPAGCTITIRQQMVIGLGQGQNIPYGTPNVITLGITSTSVSASRAGASGSRPYAF